jgi:hypothetical protein
VLHRRLERDDEGPRPAARILADDDAIDIGQRQRAFHIDREDLGMGMRRAQDRRVQGIPPNRQIVRRRAAGRHPRRRQISCPM